MSARDTTPEARDAQIAALRRLSGAERVRSAFEMCEQARRISAAGYRDRHPGCTEAEARRHVLRRILGRVVRGGLRPRPGLSLRLAEIVALLDAHAIPHMLAGSFASTYYGDPRTTNAIDLVIDPTREALDAFVAALPRERFYVSPEAVDEAWRRRGQFNVIWVTGGWKVDLILKKDRPFSRAEFDRRTRVEIEGTPVHVATAEDTIPAKLEWARAGESERQLRDVGGILASRGDTLDRGYIERWLAQLGVTKLWRRIEASRPR